MTRRHPALPAMTQSGDRETSRPYLLPQGVILRAIAYFIDSFLVAAAAFALFWVFGTDVPAPPSVVEWGAFSDYLATDFGIRLQFAATGGLVVYGTIAEALWGRTLGKYALGLEVVRAADGAGCDWRGAIVRNLLKPFDLIFAGMPGALVVMVTRRRQRLGDLAGGTLVVRRLPALPSFAGMPMPGVLKRCEGCGGLVEAAAECPRCARPPAAAEVPQPIAAMMAVGQAAAGFGAATREFLAAEAAFRQASADEYERLEAAGPARTVSGDGPEGEAAGAGQPEEVQQPPEGGGAPGDAAEPPADGGVGDEPASDLEDAEEDYTAEYTAAWSAFLKKARTLHRRYALLEEAARQAGLRVDQAAGMQPEVGQALEDLAGYLAAEDDEAVFEAFRDRALAPPAQD